jgi:hypothetical protein
MSVALRQDDRREVKVTHMMASRLDLGRHGSWGRIIWDITVVVDWRCGSVFTWELPWLWLEPGFG